MTPIMLVKGSSDSSFGNYEFLDTHSSSSTAKDIINFFKLELRKKGFKSHEIDYMAKNGFKKLERLNPYPFH